MKFKKILLFVCFMFCLSLVFCAGIVFAQSYDFGTAGQNNADTNDLQCKATDSSCEMSEKDLATLIKENRYIENSQNTLDARNVLNTPYADVEFPEKSVLKRKMIIYSAMALVFMIAALLLMRRIKQNKTK